VGKKIYIIVSQFVIFFISILPFIAMNMVTKVSEHSIEYVHDIWYTIALISIGIVPYYYYKYFIDQWYRFEDIFMLNNQTMIPYVREVQRWRRRILALLLIILIIYLIFF